MTKMQWIKLKDSFFRDKVIKKMRRQGPELALVYLEMLTASIEGDGKFFYDGVEDSIEAEIALELNEDVEVIQEVLTFLRAVHLIEEDDESIKLVQYQEMVGAGSDSAERVRRFRAKRTDVTDCNVTCNGDVTDCNVTCNESVTLDKEKELDKESEKEIKESERVCAREDFVPPTEDEVRKYLTDQGKPDYAKDFVKFNNERGWIVRGEPMKNWRNAVNGFVRDKAAPVKQPRAPAKKIGFTGFEDQRKYDFNNLEQKLLAK